MGDIVIGMDHSAGAATALRWALREADLRASTLSAVLAWGRFDHPHANSRATFEQHCSEADALYVLDTAIERAVGNDAASLVKRQVVADRPATALLRAAEGAELLVVGARGLGGFGRLLVGSVSDQCLHQATCPTAVIHTPRNPTSPVGGDETRRGHIVVGIDGSDNANHALRWALDEGRARGAAVEVVHAWQPAPIGGAPFAVPLAGTAALAAAAAAVLDTTIDSRDSTGLPEPVTRTLTCGSPAGAILQAAKDADLIVVGARGVGGLRGLLLGSVSHQVTHHALCPVVVIPTSARSQDQHAADQPQAADMST